VASFVTDISGIIPFLSIAFHFWVYHFAVVIFIVDPFDSGNTSCTDPFPYDFVPTIIPLALS
jgi:hypothetical protein